METVEQIHSTDDHCNCQDWWKYIRLLK